MRRIWFICVLCCISVLSVQADTITLSLPDVKTYLEATEDRLYRADGELSGEFQDLIQLFERDFLLRYSNTASAEQLLAAYGTYKTGIRLYGFYGSYLDIVAWQQRIISRWLENNPVDFAAVETVEFLDYTLTITDVKLNTERPAWLIQINDDNSWRFGHYWIAQQNDSHAAGYDFSPLPVPYREQNLRPSQIGGWFGPALTEIIDLNADGQDEFIFEAIAMLPWSGTSKYFQYMYVVGWRDGQPVRLLKTDLMDDDENIWHYGNTDDDAPLEIVQSVTYEDNWLCKRYERQIYNWTGDDYSQSSTQSLFAETIYCDVRQAEEAMQNGAYPQAIEHYQHARRRYAAIDNSEERSDKAPWQAFASERLVVAYAFTDNLDAARSLIDELNQQEQPDDTMAYAFGQQINATSSALEICRVANQTLRDFNWRASYRGLPGAWQIIDEAFWGDAFQGTTSHPGCDISQMTLLIMEQTPLSYDESPVEALSQQGLSFEARLSYDLNDDGIPDWLLWQIRESAESINANEHGYLLRSGAGEMYTASEMNLSSAWADDRKARLPDGTPALARVDETGVFICGEQFLCQQSALPADDTPVTAYQVYARWLTDDGISDVFMASLQERPQTNDNDVLILPERAEIPVTALYYRTRKAQVSYSRFVPHIWDADSSDYVRTEAAQQTDTFSDQTVRDLASMLYDDTVYESVLTEINAILASDDVQLSNGNRLELRYYRAVALQYTGQLDAAREAYTAIYSDAPLSEWGILSQWYAETDEVDMPPVSSFETPGD